MDVHSSIDNGLDLPDEAGADTAALAEYNSLIDSPEALAEKNDRLTKKVTEQERLISSLQIQNGDLRREASSANAMKDEYLSQKNRACATSKASLAQIEERGRLIEEQRELCEFKDEEIGNLHTTVAVQQKELDRITRMVADLALQLSTAERQHRETLQQHAERVESYASIQAHLSDLKKQHFDVRKDNQSLLRENTDLLMKAHRSYLFRLPNGKFTFSLRQKYANG